MSMEALYLVIFGYYRLNDKARHFLKGFYCKALVLKLQTYYKVGENTNTKDIFNKSIVYYQKQKLK